MIQKYQARHGVVSRMQITKETPKFVVLPLSEKRESKKDYFNTWKAAKNYLILKSQNKIDSYKKQLKEEENNMESIKNLQLFKG